MSTIEIPLSQAPDHLFDQRQWQAFVGHFETPEIALARISYPPYYPGFYRDGDPGLPTTGEEREQKIEELYRLGMALIGAFKISMTKKVFIARGRSSLSGKTVVIPTAQWAGLWPAFAENYASGKLAIYSDVRLRRNPNRRPRAAELLNWLHVRAAEKIRLKKARCEFRGCNRSIGS